MLAQPPQDVAHDRPPPARGLRFPRLSFASRKIAMSISLSASRSLLITYSGVCRARFIGSLKGSTGARRDPHSG